MLGQANAGLGVDVGGGQSGLIAGERKRYRETSGVGCAQDFLGVGAAPVVLEAARKTVGVLLQPTGLGAYLALALLTSAFPMDVGGLFHHGVVPVSSCLEGVAIAPGGCVHAGYGMPGRVAGSMHRASRPLRLQMWGGSSWQQRWWEIRVDDGARDIGNYLLDRIDSWCPLAKFAPGWITDILSGSFADILSGSFIVRLAPLARHAPVLADQSG